MKNFISLCLSTSIQKTISFDRLEKGKVNRSSSYRYDVSGKAVNCGRVLSQLIKQDGEEKNLCSTVVCPLGEKNKKLWMDVYKNDDFQLKSVDIPGFTRECCTLIDNDDKTSTELVVEEPLIDVKDKNGLSDELVSVVQEALDKKNNPLAFVMAGSKPAFWEQYLLKKLAHIAKSQGIPFMADFRGNDLISLIPDFTPDIIKVNEEEFVATVGSGLTLKGDLELADAIAEKSEYLNNIIVVTRGKEKTFAAEKGNLHFCPTEHIYPVNTIGCGDAFTARFIYEYVQSGDIEKALKKGTWCAARNAENLRPGSIL